MTLGKGNTGVLCTIATFCNCSQNKFLKSKKEEEELSQEITTHKVWCTGHAGTIFSLSAIPKSTFQARISLPISQYQGTRSSLGTRAQLWPLDYDRD